MKGKTVAFVVLVSSLALAHATYSQVVLPKNPSASSGGTGAAGGGLNSSGTGTPTDNRPQRPIYYNTGSYYYMPGKSSTRARFQHEQALQRAAAQARQRQAATGVVDNAIAPMANTGLPAGSSANVPPPPPEQQSPSDFVPSPQAGPSQMIVRPVQIPQPTQPVQPKKRSIPPPSPADPQERTEKAMPISEVSGPAYNDRDPLLGYQLDQAGKGNPESQYAVGIRYLTGNGVEQDEKQGREWLERASSNGNLRARAKLRELNAHPDS